MEEMSTSALESMKKQAGELEAQIRALPQQPGRDELLREIEELRAKLDRESAKAAELRDSP